jgi:hypothetical protein
MHAILWTAFFVAAWTALAIWASKTSSRSQIAVGRARSPRTDGAPFAKKERERDYPISMGL